MPGRLVVYFACFEELAQVTNRIVQGLYLDEVDAPLRFMAADGARESNLLGNAQPAVLETLYGTSPARPSGNEDYERYHQAYLESGPGEASLNWPYAYDATYTIALAIQAAGSSDAHDFKHHMGAISRGDARGDVAVHVGEWAKAREALLAGDDIDYEGASGPVDFTPEGDPGNATYNLWRTARDDVGGFVFEDLQELVVDTP